MDKETKEYIKARMEEIKSICKSMNLTVDILDFEETTIPTAFISMKNDGGDEEVVVTCNLIPMRLDEVSALFLQFYMCISADVGEEKIDEVNEFVKKQNEHFMIGNLMVFENCVFIKNAIYLNTNNGMNQEEFERSLDVFIYQAGIMLEKIQLLIGGEETVEDLILSGSLFV